MEIKIKKELDNFVIDFLEMEMGYSVDDEDEDEFEYRIAVIHATLEWIRLQPNLN